MAGLGKQLRGSGIARINKAAGGEVEGQQESLAPEGIDYPEASESLEPHYDESPSILSLKEKTKIVSDKLKKRLKDNIKFVTPSGPDLSDIKKTLGLKKCGSVKKGGSVKTGLYANINKRKKLGISRPKTKSTISAKSYANMKAGFPKKK